MQLSDRLLELLRALYWNLGSDPAQEISIDWFLDEGRLQSGRDADGQPIYIDGRLKHCRTSQTWD